MSQKKAREARRIARAAGVDTTPEPKRPTQKYLSKRDAQKARVASEKARASALNAVAAAAAATKRGQ